MLVTPGQRRHIIIQEGEILQLIEYTDIIAQLKYPGVSKCMSDIYRASNMDDLQYSYDLTAGNCSGKTVNDGISA